MNIHKIIYVLYGAENTGKTSTLRRLAKLFALVSEYEGDLHEEKDFCVTFMIKGRKVAVISGGDDANAISTGIEQVEDDSECDFIFCASRTKGQTTDFLHNEYSKEELRWVHQLSVYFENGEQHELTNIAISDFLYQSFISEINA
ncbi:MAG: hypothetical protein ACSHXJ_06925 [Marinomonas colpomeniae]